MSHYLDNKLVFVAGATGMVGTALLERLLSDHPRTKIRACWNRREPFLKHERIEYVRGDLRSMDFCRVAVKGADCAIMAAAESVGSKVTTSEPWHVLNANLLINSQLLEAFYREKVGRIVFVGSSTLYQECNYPIKEDMLDMSEDPHPVYFAFGWLTRFIEKMCRFWHERGGFDVLIARASNVYGPYDKFDPEVSNFIPALIKKAVDKMDPFQVWGSPDVVRDVVYAEDFARGVLVLLGKTEFRYDVFNLGQGSGVKVSEVVDSVLQNAGHRPSRLTYDQSKPSTFKCRVLDCTKAKEILGWAPKCSVEEGIKKTVDWWLANKGWWKR